MQVGTPKSKRILQVSLPMKLSGIHPRESNNNGRPRQGFVNQCSPARACINLKFPVLMRAFY
jgi:hypothetical protein